MGVSPPHPAEGFINPNDPKATTASRASAEVHALLEKMQHEEPYLPDTEAVLRCHAKRRLYRAFKQAGSPTTAEWLFASPNQPFHPDDPVLPPVAFANALAIRSQQLLSEPGSAPAPPKPFSHNPLSSTPNPASKSRSPLEPGNDMLLVPVRHTADGRVLGYTFGAIQSFNETLQADCPFGRPDYPFLPHFVGRFSYDTALDDLLIIAHCLCKGRAGITNLRMNENGTDRERTRFIVPGGNYAFRRLPGRVLTMIALDERRVPKPDGGPKLQFAGVKFRSFSSSSDNEMRQSMAKMENLVKGAFVCDKACRDDMDEKSGQILNRMTSQVHSDFDAMDAVGLEVFKDLAMRTYYSFASAAKQRKAATRQAT